MTPTLLGRLQTRLLLFVFIGLPVTFLYSWYVLGLDHPEFLVPFRVLFSIFLIGVLLDPIYIFIQGFRWDQDWPFAFQAFFSTVEFFIVLGLSELSLFSFLEFSAFSSIERFYVFLTHFGIVLFFSMIAVLGGLQIFLVRWRFKGGELGRM